MNDLGWLLLMLGAGFFGAGLAMAICDIMKARRNHDKMLAYLEQMKADGEKLLQQTREDSKQTSELMLRDKLGKLLTIKIVIDPFLDSEEDTTVEEFQEKVASGEAGSIKDIIKGDAKVDSRLGDCNNFVFSQKSIDQMRQHGVEPEDVVIKMLRAAGRID